MGGCVSQASYAQTMDQVNDMQKNLAVLKKDVTRLEEENAKKEQELEQQKEAEERKLAAMEKRITSVTRSATTKSAPPPKKKNKSVAKKKEEEPEEEEESEEEDDDDEPSAEPYASESGEDGDDLIGEDQKEPEVNFMSVKPWLGSVVKPSKPPSVDKSKPDVELDLEWVHGYRCHDSRSNLVYNSEGHLVYPVAAVVVTMDPEARTQNFYRGHNDDILCLAQNPDNLDIVATGQIASKVDGHSEPPKICIHNTVTKEDWVIPNAHQRAVQTIAFSHDGKYLAATGNDDKKTVTVWDWQNKKKLASAPTAAKSVLGIKWSRTEENQFVTVGARHVAFWTFEGKSLKSKKTSVGTQVFTSVCFSDKGFACVGANDNKLYVFVGGKLRKEFPAIHPGSKASIGCVLECDGGVISGGVDGTVVILDNKIKPKNTLKFKGKVISMSYHDDDLCVGTNYGSIYVVPDFRNCSDTDDLTPVMQGHHDGELWALCVDPSSNGEYATAGEDNKLNIWKLSTHELVRSTQINQKAGAKSKNNKACTSSKYPPNQQARSLDYFPDGKHIAIGTNNGECTVFLSATLEIVCRKDLNQFGNRKVFNQKLNWIEMLKYSPSGHTLAVATHGIVIVLLGVASGYKPKQKLTSHAAAVTNLDWSNDGKHMQSVCLGYELLFHDVREDALKESKQNTKAKSLKDTKWSTQSCKFGWWVDGIFVRDDGTSIEDGTQINCVEISGDRKLCLTGDNDGNINVFRFPVQKVAKKKSFGGHSSHVMRVKFTKDNKYVLSVGGNDKALMQWKVNQS